MYKRQHYHQAIHQFEAHGIKVKEVTIDMPQMIKRKNEVVDQTCKGVAFLMKKNKIYVVYGTAAFLNENEIQVTKSDGSTENIIAEKIILATGSKPITPPSFNYDKKRIITSTEALNINQVPGHMAVSYTHL